MALECREVTVTRGGVRLLDGVGLSLSPGELLAVAGPNGAGKTTLVRCLAGALAPDEGQVLLEGRPLAGMRRRELARQVAYCPQEGQDRFGFSVRQTALLGRHPHMGRLAAPSGEDLAAVSRALKAMDLETLADRPVTVLSGGEKRRAALARTLAQGGRCYLFDEPAAGLDIRHALAAMRVFRDLAASGAAVAVVLHDLNLAAMFCPLTILLAGGRVAAYGATPRVLTPGNLARVFGVRAEVSNGCVRYLED